MFKQGFTIARLGPAIIFASVAIVSMALPASAQFKQLPMEPLHETGQGVTPSFEGWWQNADGTYNLMFGYFNRNTKEVVQVPVGPNNHIDPGGPDQGQPAFFVPRRQWGVFTVTVPKDFGPDKKVTWTITANGQTLSVPGHLGPAWSITPMSEIGIGNTPPTIAFDEKGAYIQGPKPLLVERTAKVGEPLALTVYAADDDKSLFRPAAAGRGGAGGRGGRGGGRGGAAETPAPAGSAAAPKPADPTADLAAAAAAAGVDADTIAQFLNPNAVNLTWSQYRGPADVKFSTEKPKMVPTPNSGIPVKNVFNGKATTTATFSQPGEYWLRVVANDSSGPGGGGFLCCWTNGLVKVTVK